MTLKHIDFSDSVTMRSFLKVALEKGLVEETSSVEIAAQEIAAGKLEERALTFTPTENLLENVLNLAAGLRAKGFDKYADALEDHVLNVKIAESNYNVSNETGDELVENAHPEGSVQIDEGKSEHGMVHTITDRHEKILKVVQKKSKLSSAEAINLLKVVLAVDTTDSVQQFKSMLYELIKGVEAISAGFGRAKNLVNVLDISHWGGTSQYKDILFSNGKTVNDYLTDFENFIRNYYRIYSDGFNKNEVSGEDVKFFSEGLDKVLEFFKLCEEKVNEGSSPNFDNKSIGTEGLNRYGTIKKKFEAWKVNRTGGYVPADLSTAITAEDLKSIFFATKIKFQTLGNFLNRVVLSYDPAKSDAEISKFINGIKEYIDSSIKTMDMVSNLAEIHINTNAIDGTLNVNKIKVMFGNSALAQSIDFSDFNSFKSSLVKIPAMIKEEITTLINKNPKFSNPEGQAILARMPASV